MTPFSLEWTLENPSTAIQMLVERIVQRRFSLQQHVFLYEVTVGHVALAGVALLRGWCRGSAGPLPLHFLPLLLRHRCHQARHAGRPGQSIHHTGGRQRTQLGHQRSASTVASYTAVKETRNNRHSIKESDIAWQVALARVCQQDAVP